jgi:hypothetical protein
VEAAAVAVEGAAAGVQAAVDPAAEDPGAEDLAAEDLAAVDRAEVDRVAVELAAAEAADLVEAVAGSIAPSKSSLAPRPRTTSRLAPPAKSGTRNITSVS